MGVGRIGARRSGMSELRMDGRERVSDTEGGDGGCGLGYRFLDGLGVMSGEEMMELAMDPEKVMELLEVSLYPSEESGEGFKYSMMATELLCTSAFLDVLISGYTFGMDFSIGTGSGSDSNSGSNSDSDSGSEQCLGYGSFGSLGLRSRPGRRESIVFGLCDEKRSGNGRSRLDKDLGFSGIEYRVSSGKEQGDVRLGTGVDDESRLDRIYAMPISVLIAFALGDNDAYELDLGLGPNVVGISNFSKLVYSLMIYDMDWTWRYVLSAGRGEHLVLRLAGWVHHPSVFHLFKFIVGTGCDDSQLIGGTEVSLAIIIRSMCQNLWIDDEGGFGDKLTRSKDRTEGCHLLKSTCEFLVDLFEGVLDLGRVRDHFAFEHIGVEFTPLSMDTKLSRRMRHFPERGDGLGRTVNDGRTGRWSLGDAIMLPEEVVYELLFSLGRSVQSLDLLLGDNIFLCEKLEDLNLYSGLASGLMLVVNAIVKVERERRSSSRDKERGGESKSAFGVKTLKWMNQLRDRIWNLNRQSSDADHQASANALFKKASNQQTPPTAVTQSSRLKMINLEMIGIIGGGLSGILAELCMRGGTVDSSQGRGRGVPIVTRGAMVSLMVEVLDYVKTLVDSEDLELLRSLVEGTERQDGAFQKEGGGTSAIWEMFDLIIFRGKVANSVLEEKVLSIFRTCLDHIDRDRMSALGCRGGRPRPNSFDLHDVTCTSRYLVLGYFKYSGFLTFMGKDKRRETWMDDRILRRAMISAGKGGRPATHLGSGVIRRAENIENSFDSNIKLGISRILRNQSRRSFSKVGSGHEQSIAEYLYKEAKFMQESMPWISHYLW